MYISGFQNQNSFSLPITPIYYPSFAYEPITNYTNISPTFQTFLTFSYEPMNMNQEIFTNVDYDSIKETHTQIDRLNESIESSPKKQKIQISNKMLRPKKNVESNISNQVFSYITNEHKSINALSKILKQNREKIDLYYSYIECFVKNKKKYLSRKYLGDLCIMTLDRDQCREIAKKKKLQVFSIEEFRAAIAYLVFHYLRNKCTINVLTSMKLSSELRREHLERKRQILSYLQEYVRPDYKYGFR